MGCCKMSDMAFWLVTAVAMMSTLVVVEGQNLPPCAEELVPCAPYLNSTNPPGACCNPLRQAVEKERDCLCELFKDRSSLESIGINVTQALELPKHCNINADITSCQKAPASPPTVMPPPPPGTPGGETGGVS